MIPSGTMVVIAPVMLGGMRMQMHRGTGRRMWAAVAKSRANTPLEPIEQMQEELHIA